MAGLGQTFNPTEHDTEQREFENLPDGIYRMEVSASDVKQDNGKTGLKVTYDVIEPEAYKGRKIFDYFNLEHPNAQAQEIGQKQFASLCRALEITDPVNDSEELHFIAFTAKVGLGKPSEKKQADGTIKKYEASNKISRYFFPDENNVPEPAVTAANDNRRAANDNSRTTTKPAAAAAGGETKSRPWGKK